MAVVTVEDPGDLREPAAGNAVRLDEVDAIRVMRFTPATLDRELARADVAIDAVFGTGFRGVPEDEWADAIAGLNASPALVVAVDIPSGVNGATGAVDGDAVARTHRHVRRAEGGAWSSPEPSWRGSCASRTSGSRRSSCERRCSRWSPPTSPRSCRAGHRHP